MRQHHVAWTAPTSPLSLAPRAGQTGRRVERVQHAHRADEPSIRHGGQSGQRGGPTTGYGSVGYTYQMGTYDVTAGQYCAVPERRGDDGHLRPVQLVMDGQCDFPTISIIQSGSSGSYSYSVAGDYSQAATVRSSRFLGRRRAVLQLAAKRPADRRRGDSTTETGAYTSTATTTIA